MAKQVAKQPEPPPVSAWRPRPPKPLGTRRRYLGSWVLPSGNSCDVYLGPGLALAAQWDTPPSPAWPAEDVEHYCRVTFPEIVRAVAAATGQRVVGVEP